MGEGVRVEFKETFLYDVHQDQANKGLKTEVAKEICSFANAQGGTLVIGIEDSEREVKGIERDLRLMKDGKDDFELQLNQTVRDKLGESFASLCTQVEFEEIENSEICVVTVERSSEPVFYGDEKDFYVRIGSSANPLSIQEANKYINQNWA